jgi:hypothetical protein
MKRKTKDGPIFAFIRKGNSLIPEFAYDAAALDGIAQGQRVRLSLEHWRNLDRLKAYWMLLTECLAATECAPSKEALHQFCKIKCGLGEPISMPNGDVIIVPGSVAIDRLTEDGMISYFQNVERLLAVEFGFVKERNAA